MAIDHDSKPQSADKVAEPGPVERTGYLPQEVARPLDIIARQAPMAETTQIVRPFEYESMRSKSSLSEEEKDAVAKGAMTGVFDSLKGEHKEMPPQVQDAVRALALRDGYSAAQANELIQNISTSADMDAYDRKIAQEKSTSDAKTSADARTSAFYADASLSSVKDKLVTIIRNDLQNDRQHYSGEIVSPSSPAKALKGKDGNIIG